MPYFVTLEIVDGNKPAVTRTFTQVEIEVSSFGDIEIDDDDFDSDDFKINVLPEEIFLKKDWDNPKLMVNGSPVPEQSSIKIGDVITQGGSSYIKVVAAGEKSDLPEQGSRYVEINILDKCPHCGSGQPMNGLLSEVPCDNCHKPCHPKPEYWESVLETVLDDYHKSAGSFSLNFEINVRWTNKAPKCSKCSADLPADQVPTGQTDDIICPSCGAANSTYPAPEWLNPVLPSIAQVFCADRQSQGGPSDIDTSGAKPVILACPSCGGSLKIIAGSERTVTCQYCSSDVYLPDDLWSRLHPKKTAITWYFRLEGQTKKEREQENERAEKVSSARAEIEKAAYKEEEKVLREKKKKWNAVLTIGVFFLLGSITVVGVLSQTIGTPSEEPLGDAEQTNQQTRIQGTAIVPGYNWAQDQLQSTRVNTNNIWFSLNAPAGLTPANDGTTIFWQHSANGSGRSMLTVRVTGVAKTATNAMEAMTISAARTMVSGTSTATANGQVPNGFTITMRGSAANFTEAIVYKTRAGLPPGSPGLECRASLQTVGEEPLVEIDQAEAYLYQICGSLNVE